MALMTKFRKISRDLVINTAANANLLVMNGITTQNNFVISQIDGILVI